eukprot:GHVU01167863.1.p2 GENE.GHVU01167863.1~~GHVU01167863.1.p2  ORF type:complete len:268 (-),score=65.00 GHVU01167863.1:330-1133(-)
MTNLEPNVMKQVQLAEDFAVWSANASILYDYVASYTTEWPALAVLWLPGLYPRGDAGKLAAAQQCVFTTHTAGGEQNYLNVVELLLPTTPLTAHQRKYSPGDDYEGFQFPPSVPPLSSFEYTLSLPVPYEINRAAAMPQRPGEIVAALDCDGGVSIVSLRQQSKENEVVGAESKPNYFKAHVGEGWGVAWNPCREGLLATVGDDRKLAVWDVNASRNSQTTTTTTAAAEPSAGMFMNSVCVCVCVCTCVCVCVCMCVCVCVCVCVQS